MLSVVIVNYNVKYFLEQCLLSVQKAALFLQGKNQAYQTEIFVVDNNSVDSSVNMVKNKFPDCRLIVNNKNMGFSAANNQAIRLSKGKYVLLLNPDTVVEENTFYEVISFMEEHPEAGGLGVKMIDGKGKFLPESKRSLPTPAIAFYKIFGLSRIFPRSKRFGRYHLSYLDEDMVHEVEVLSGACFFIRKDVLNQIGLLDERFFMYGEDIDLSYRITKAGFKNYYFPKTRIIHYKGESTKRSSVNYVVTFYSAMIIFAKKHFTGGQARFFSFLINSAIYFRAFLAIVHRTVNSLFIPVLDIILIYSGLNMVRLFWENYGHGMPYPEELIFKYFPLYTMIWAISLLVVRAHKQPFSLLKIGKGIIFGAVVISILYAFLSESERFSRAIIILGTISSFLLVFLNRLILSFIFSRSFRLNFNRNLRIGIVGNTGECQRVSNLLSRSAVNFSFVGFISPDNQETTNNGFIGSLSQINEIIKIYRLNELIFCAEDISSSTIIRLMTEIDNRQLIYKIAPPQSLFIIGSNHKNQAGDLYTIDIQLALLLPEKKLNKRLLDIVFSVFLFLLSPFFIFFVHHKSGLYRNIFRVLNGKYSWVGFNPKESTEGLPKIRPGIVYPKTLSEKADTANDISGNQNLFYAKDYSILTDIQIILQNFPEIGRNPY